MPKIERGKEGGAELWDYNKPVKSYEPDEPDNSGTHNLELGTLPTGNRELRTEN